MLVQNRPTHTCMAVCITSTLVIGAESATLVCGLKLCVFLWQVGW